jgi:hypothetical protein
MELAPEEIAFRDFPFRSEDKPQMTKWSRTPWAWGERESRSYYLATEPRSSRFNRGVTLVHGHGMRRGLLFALDRKSLDDVVRYRNQEDRDQRRRQHPSDYRRTHDSPRDSTGT